MKTLSKFLMAAALVAPALASAQTATWTKNYSYTVGDSVVSVYSASLLTSATAETGAYTASAKSCITVDHLSPTTASRTITIKSSPVITGGISVTAVAGVSPTGAGTHSTIAGQARRVWVTGTYVTGASGPTSATITDVTNCQR